jgi:hypothetical protein
MLDEVVWPTGGVQASNKRIGQKRSTESGQVSFQCRVDISRNVLVIVPYVIVNLGKQRGCSFPDCGIICSLRENVLDSSFAFLRTHGSAKCPLVGL